VCLWLKKEEPLPVAAAAAVGAGGRRLWDLYINRPSSHFADTIFFRLVYIGISN
jgi:hypothetical protein